MKKQLKIILDSAMYRKLKIRSEQLSYLSVQELIRDLIRERFAKSGLERFGERVERKIKRIV